MQPISRFVPFFCLVMGVSFLAGSPSMAAGATVREAASLANHAGGIVCGEVGIVPIDPKILYEILAESSQGLEGR